MIASNLLSPWRSAAFALGMLLAIPAAQADWHGGGGGGWHGGGGGWHGGGEGWHGGWGWGPGVTFGFPFFVPPPAYYYPPPVYYPPPAYYPPPYFPPRPYPYGYAPGPYGSAAPPTVYSSNNCGTPDDPKACTR